MTKIGRLLLWSVVLLTGCADMGATAEAGPAYEEKVLVTGSNIPRRQRQSEVSAFSKEDAENALRTMNLSPPVSAPSR